MKKLFGLFLGLASIFALVSCGEPTQPQETKLATPTNFTIVDNHATWDAVENASKYRLNIVNEEAKEVKRVVNGATTADMKSFNLEKGKYEVFIQAVATAGSGYLDSDYTTEPVKYEVKGEYPVVTSISGKDLVDSEYVKWQGRTSYNETEGINMIYHSASSFEVKFTGTEVTVELFATKYNDSAHRPYVVYMLDDNYEKRVRVALSQKYTTLKIADLAEDDGEIHTVALYKSTESTDSHIGLKSITTNGSFIPEIEYKERHIEFIAASSSTGHGNLGSPTVGKSTENSDCMQAFSYLTARALNADISIYSASGWGVKFSKWTSPNTLNLFDAYKNLDFFSDVKWDITKITPDVIVINLGTNDWSYISNTTDPSIQADRLKQFQNQYVDFLNYLHNIYPNCKIIMFYGLMNEKHIFDATKEIYNMAKVTNPDLAILQVTGDAQGSASHPSVNSHKQVAQLLISKIEYEMGW